MEIYTIGFTRKTAAQFFGLLRQHNIRRLVDVRLNNVSQLAGFTKRDDLRFLLQEVAGIEYTHEPLLAPTKEMLDAYKKKHGPWSDYERRFFELMEQREIEQRLDPATFADPTVLLCSEPTPDRCHRRLVVEYLERHWPSVRAHHL